MLTKTCRQCGKVKPIEQFRNYYGGRKGTYTTCLACESINARAKYLRNKGTTISEEEQAELDKIELLYDTQRKLGLKPPRRRTKRYVEAIDDMIASYEQQGTELESWLTRPLTEAPEYYINEIYERLVATYRPCLYIDRETLHPVYDETHTDILDQILVRFNKYEDDYYAND